MLLSNTVLTYMRSAIVNSVAFSPNENRLASGSEDGVTKLWNLDTGEAIRTYTDHTDAITAVVFSEDGQTLISASKDDTVRVW